MTDIIKLLSAESAKTRLKYNSTSSLWRTAICRSSSAFFALRRHSSASFLHASHAYNIEPNYCDFEQTQ